MRSYLFIPLLVSFLFPVALANASLEKNLVDTNLYLSPNTIQNRSYTAGFNLKNDYFRKSFNFDNEVIQRPNQNNYFAKTYSNEWSELVNKYSDNYKQIIRDNNFHWYNNIYYLKNIKLKIESSYIAHAFSSTFRYPGIRNSWSSDIHSEQRFYFHSQAISNFFPRDGHTNEKWTEVSSRNIEITGTNPDGSWNKSWYKPDNPYFWDLTKPSHKKAYFIEAKFVHMWGSTLRMIKPTPEDVIRNIKWLRKGNNGNYVIDFNAPMWYYLGQESRGFFADWKNNIFVAPDFWWGLAMTPIRAYRFWWDLELVKVPPVFEQNNAQWNEPFPGRSSWFFSINSNKQVDAHWMSINEFKEKMKKDRKIIEAFTNNREITQTILRLGNGLVVRPETEDSRREAFNSKWDIFKHTPILPEQEVVHHQISFYLRQNNPDEVLPISFSNLSKLWISQLEFDINSLVSQTEKTLNKETIGTKIKPTIKFKDKFINAIKEVSLINQRIDESIDKNEALKSFNISTNNQSNFYPNLDYLYNLLQMSPNNKEELFFIRNLPRMVKTIFDRSTLTVKVKIGNSVNEITLLRNNKNYFDLSSIEEFLTEKQKADNEMNIEFLALNFFVDGYESENISNYSVEPLFDSIKKLSTIKRTKDGFEYKFKYRKDFNEQRWIAKDFRIPLNKNVQNFNVAELKKRNEKFNDYEKRQMAFIIKNSFKSKDKNIDLDINSNSLTFVDNPKKYFKHLEPTNEKKGIFYVLAEINNSNELFKYGSESDSEIIKDKMYFLSQNQKNPKLRTYLFKFHTNKLFVDKNDLGFKLEKDKVFLSVDNLKIAELDLKSSSFKFLEDYQLDFHEPFSLNDEQLLVDKLNITLSEKRLQTTKNVRFNLKNKFINIHLVENKNQFNLVFDVDVRSKKLFIKGVNNDNQVFSISYDLKITNNQTLLIVDANGFDNSIWFDITSENQTQLFKALSFYLKQNNLQFKRVPDFNLKSQDKSYEVDKLEKNEIKKQDTNVELILWVIFGIIISLMISSAVLFLKWRKKKIVKKRN